MDEKKKTKDKRLLERDYSRGLVKDDAVNAYLAALPDDTANAQWVEVELHDAELGSGDDLDGSNSGNHSENP